MTQQDAVTSNRFKTRHILLALLVLFTGWFVFFRVSVHLRLGKCIEDLQAQGYPLSLRELGESYRLPAGADNAADYYMTAFSHYVTWDDEALDGVPWVSRGDRSTRTGAWWVSRCSDPSAWASTRPPWLPCRSGATDRRSTRAGRWRSC